MDLNPQSNETEGQRARRLGFHVGLPPADLFSSYESGTFTNYATTYFHSRSDLSGKSSGTAKFFSEQSGQNGITRGETNMPRGGSLEKGHWLTIEKIGFKAWQRSPSASDDVSDKLWYQRVLMTLFAYGVVSFHVSGMAHLGHFRLSQLLPCVQSVGQLGGVSAEGGVSGNSAPVMAAGVFDLGGLGRPIMLSELVSFGAELDWDIPNRKWDSVAGKHVNLDAGNPLDAELMSIPPGTIAEIQLIGTEQRAQG